MYSAYASLSNALGKEYEFLLLSYNLYSFEFVYTSIIIPYDTLAVEMTSDFNQRTYLTGFKAMFGKLANFLGAAIPGFLIGMHIRLSLTSLTESMQVVEKKMFLRKQEV